ncbi:Asparagine synthetase [glutamine-hydrolyzing] 3 (plasmid) [Piscirickettsia salmonis]|uniref:asparagine synthase-related protein n=1 Tax=Piscirickettsia salmonis TaxID=1238 RepID=UPI0018AD0E10|nr:asparagine synthase-related protein [Piscirickettsia salmonis]QGP52548.1 Asparagine synthetase [glutamine-hydrolyzing] 3 [Piscirickettsia salmonis]
MTNFYSEKFKSLLSEEQPYISFINKIAKPKHLNSVNKSVYYWLHSFFPENILSFLGDRSEMAHSIEGRLPFLDQKLSAFCLNLPIELKLNDNCEKYILREAMKDIIPTEVYKRSKHIFAAPPTTKLFTDFCVDIINSTEFKNMGFFKQSKCLNFIYKIASGSLSKRDFMIAEFSLNLILSTFFLYKNIVN